MSPLKNDMKAMRTVSHWKSRVAEKSGYSHSGQDCLTDDKIGLCHATVAKLFEIAHKAQEAGKQIDKTLYDKAKDDYEEAFYRVCIRGSRELCWFP